MKLRIKMPLIYALLIASLGITSVIFMSYIVKDYIVKEEEGHFKGIISTLVLNSANAIVHKDYAALIDIVDNMRKGEHVIYAIILDEKGMVIAHSRHDLEGKILDDPVSLKASATNNLLMQEVGSDIIDVTAPLMIAGQKWGAVRIGFSLAEIKIRVAKARNIILFAGLIATLLGIVASILIAQKITNPIYKLHKGTEIISKGNLDYRLDISTGDEIEQLSNAFNMMTEHLQKNYLALRESEERFRSMVEATSDWVWAVDQNGVYTYASPKVKDLLGYEPEEVIGKTPFDLMPQEEARRVRQLFQQIAKAQEPFAGLENTNLPKDGRLVVLETSGVPIFDAKGNFQGYRGIDRDITERKRLEAQLRQVQKMEAIGTLAGGIAHDFNNMLNAIMGYGGLIQMDMKEDDPHRAYLKEMLDAAERASHLTKGLLAFSRKQPMETKPVNINEIVIGFKKMIKRMIGEDIELNITLTDRDLTVMADSGQIEQVLMNLATNARDAMPEGGILSIEIGLTEINKEYINTHGYGKEGMYAIIAITDTGIGMDEMTRQRIFEPFFTTKELGRGTGLGLAIVYGIVKQHNGYIDCYSELGKGTTFKIYLPLIKKEIEEEKIELPPVRGGTETILLAEDEDAVRRASMTVLERYGYNVIEAVDGEDAVNKFMENKDRIQLLMLDVIMPKKGGKEAYDEIKKIRPDIKTIFTSGYTADMLDRKGMLEEGINFVFKPIPPDGLLRKVREVLDR